MKKIAEKQAHQVPTLDFQRFDFPENWFIASSWRKLDFLVFSLSCLFLCVGPTHFYLLPAIYLEGRKKSVSYSISLPHEATALVGKTQVGGGKRRKPGLDSEIPPLLPLVYTTVLFPVRPTPSAGRRCVRIYRTPTLPLLG